MGIIATLFGGSEAASKTIDFVTDSVKGIGNFIDEQEFTEQEKAVHNAQTAAMLLKAIEATRKENSVQSVTRRYLAWGIMGSFIALIMLTALSFKLDPEYSKFLFDLATKSVLGELAIGVGALYFLANVIRAK